MEKIDIKTLKKWVVAPDMRLSLVSGAKLGRISKNISLVLDKNSEEFSQLVTGYNFVVGDKTISCQSVDEVVETLEKLGFILNGTVTVNSINETFDTYAEFLEDKKFKTASMQEILEKVESLGANRFVLVSDFGKNKLSQVFAQGIFENTLSDVLSACKYLYENLQNFEISFNGLIEKIFIEWSSCFSGFSAKDGYQKFKENTKSVREDEILLPFYEQFDFLSECKICLDESISEKAEIPFDIELEKDENKSLKSALIDLEIGFSCHAEAKNTLLKTFSFTLNEDTKSYLLQFENDYSIVGFSHLAFYKDEKLLFSSNSKTKQHYLVKE